MPRLFNTPPGWPEPPPGWNPEPGWLPDPTWPAPPPGWQLWTGDDTATDQSPAVPAAAQPNASAPPTVNTKGRWLGWLAAILVVLLGAVSSGLSGALVMTGLLSLAVTVIVLIRGRLSWASLHRRSTSAASAGLAVVALATGAAMGSTPPSPTVDSVPLPAQTSINAPTTTPPTSPAAAPPEQTTTTPAAAATTVTAPAVTPSPPPSSPAAAQRSTPAPAPPAAVVRVPAPTPAQAPVAQAPAAPKSAPPTPSPAASSPAASGGVHPGAFCSAHGSLGTTSDGTPMICSTTATDTRYRWRHV